MNNSSTKLCRSCNTEKPVSEFYTRPSGTLYHDCKKCHTKTTAQYPAKDQTPPEHEIRGVQWLKSMGIPALHGRELDSDEFYFVDIAAFGCVKIEIKTIQLDGRIYFTDRQCEKPSFDIVIVERYEREYHIFKGDHHQFYEKGALKKVFKANILNYSLSLNRIDIIEYALMAKRFELIRAHEQVIPMQQVLFG